MSCHRGTSNSNDRGSAEARRRSRAWLMKAYAADYDVLTPYELDLLDQAFAQDGQPFPSFHANLDFESGLFLVPPGLGRPACRCYRCGRILDDSTMERDRINPGANGGRYKRENIRPACSGCNIKTGNEYKALLRKRRLERNAKARARRAAKKAA